MRDAYTWTLVGGDLALDLCNTRSWRGDPDRNIERLCSLTEYDSWREAVAQVHGTELPAVTNEAELARIHLLRDTVLQVLDARAGDREASGDATRRLFEMWMSTLSRCTVSNSVPMRLSIDPRRSTAASDELTLHCVEVLSGNLDLVRRCGLDECSWYFRDTTRNHSRRWCMADECGNRYRVRAYARRHK